MFQFIVSRLFELFRTTEITGVDEGVQEINLASLQSELRHLTCGENNSLDYSSGSELDCEFAFDSSDDSLIHDEHPFYQALPKVVERALAEFYAWRGCQGHADSSGSRPSRNTGEGQSFSRSAKRRRVGDDGQPNQSDEDESPPRSKSKAYGENEDLNTVELSLACPYYKHDRFRYRKCLVLDLKKISYVKQHLRRQHIQPHYCPVCGQIFNSHADQEVHIRSRQCTQQDFEAPQGITQDQDRILSSRVDKRLSLEQQWFSVWDIIFPGVERPESPYIQGPIHEVLSSSRQFLRERGPGLIAEHLQANGEIPYDTPNEERHLGALLRIVGYRLINRFIDELSERYSSDLSGSQGSEVSSNSERPHPLTSELSSQHVEPISSQLDQLEFPMQAVTTLTISGSEIENQALRLGSDPHRDMASHDFIPTSDDNIFDYLFYMDDGTHDEI
ncbi:hypothetical protein Hte_004925 [Hypoxylon texense]